MSMTGDAVAAFSEDEGARDMIMISSEAGVRLAKAGKALEQSIQDRAAAVGGKNIEEKKRLGGEWCRCEREYRAAVNAVQSELYEQNLHNMTGP